MDALLNLKCVHRYLMSGVNTTRTIVMSNKVLKVVFNTIRKWRGPRIGSIDIQRRIYIGRFYYRGLFFEKVGSKKVVMIFDGHL